MVEAIPKDVREAIIRRIPAGRLAHPREIARAVSFLVAEESGYITGANLSVNGGLYMGS
jgi:acetoacetyl-CoA reductase